MRKLFLFIIVVMFSIPCFAGAYPDSYYGSPLQEGCIEVEAYVTEFHNRFPWSMPDPTEKIYWLGTLCVEGGVAVLDFHTIAWRICKRSIFNPDLFECYAWYAGSVYGDTHIMGWVGEVDWGFYIAQIFDGEKYLYDSLTYQGDQTALFLFTQGVFKFVPPLWYEEDDEYSRWVMLGTSRSVPLLRPVLRATGRVH